MMDVVCFVNLYVICYVVNVLIVFIKIWEIYMRFVLVLYVCVLIKWLCDFGGLNLFIVVVEMDFK